MVRLLACCTIDMWSGPPLPEVKRLAGLVMTSQVTIRTITSLLKALMYQPALSVVSREAARLQSPAQVANFKHSRWHTQQGILTKLPTDA